MATTIPKWLQTGNDAAQSEGLTFGSNADSNYGDGTGLGIMGSTSTGGPWSNMNDADMAALKKMGWDGSNPVVTTVANDGNAEAGGSGGAPSYSWDPKFQKFMDANGITPSEIQTPGAAGPSTDFALYGPNSTGRGVDQIGTTDTVKGDNNKLWMALTSAALGAGGALASGAIGAGAGFDTLEGGATPLGALSDNGGALSSLAEGGGGADIGGIDDGESFYGDDYGAEASDAGGGSYGQPGVSTAAQNMNATNPALIDSATGTPGYAASSAGPGGSVAGLSATSIPGGGVLSSIADKLGSLTPGQIVKGIGAVTPLLGALAGNGSKGISPVTAAAVGSPSKAGALGLPANQFSYNGFHVDPSTIASRPGHTMGPSSAVNLNDPMASMFGYGTKPVYYQQPTPAAAPTDPRVGIGNPQGVPMASGGSVVNDDYGNPMSLDGGADTSFRGPLNQNTSAANDYGLGAPDAGYGIDLNANYGSPSSDDGPMSWLSKIWNGGDKNRKPAMVMGGLGLLATILQGRKGRGYQTPAQLQASVRGSENNTMPSLAANASKYFSRPANVYVPPSTLTNPFTGQPAGAAPKPLYAMADGGRVEPVIGSRSPLPSGGGGGLSKEAMIRALIAASRPPPPPQTNAPAGNFLTNPRAVLEGQLSAEGEGMASGGQPRMPPPRFNPQMHGPLVVGQGGGQADQVPASLSPGEYVHDADIVSSLGDGNNEEGARLLKHMGEMIRAHKRSAPPTSIPPAALSPLEYMRGAR